eukprot:NODE_463_length_2722_cov_52.901885_g396_i0.p1 GENE.NODE_463_length_2722_cov_52.901885_g396_i0~~NODE_463_length_2722_cov_52.901885_g396_i0.p1  ORF type:complete len:630 (-),score=134.76 NODE_463_length_2722_cov_52.901885_g396_i0:832-2553(-)
MDIHMQRMDGLTAASHIRSYETDKGIRASVIIGMTADTHELIGGMAKTYGMNKMVIKPVTPKLLRDVCIEFGLPVQRSLPPLVLANNAYELAFKKIVEAEETHPQHSEIKSDVVLSSLSSTTLGKASNTYLEPKETPKQTLAPPSVKTLTINANGASIRDRGRKAFFNACEKYVSKIKLPPPETYEELFCHCVCLAVCSVLTWLPDLVVSRGLWRALQNYVYATVMKDKGNPDLNNITQKIMTNVTGQISGVLSGLGFPPLTKLESIDRDECCRRFLLEGNGVQRKKYEVGAYSDIGGRPDQEDAYIVVPDVSVVCRRSGYCQADTEVLVGVFDGHSGGQAAIFARETLFYETIRSDRYPQDPSLALADGFWRTNDKFCEKAASVDCNSGTTALIVLLRENTLWVANLGDCGAVLCRKGKAIQITRPHRANDPQEQAMVKASGGNITYCYGCARVDGVLQVTRSLGDIPCRQSLTAEPEVFIHPVMWDQDQFLIAASDGLWNVISADLAVQLVQQARDEVDYARKNVKIDENKDNEYIYSYDKIAQGLVDEATQRGSTDNVTVVILFFNQNLT